MIQRPVDDAAPAAASSEGDPRPATPRDAIVPLPDQGRRRGEDSIGETRALAGAILAGGPVPFGPRLVVVEGPSAGTALALRDGAVLGRGWGAELRLSDSLASRRHAVFTIRDGRARLRDLSSKNGLTVNGRRVGPAEIALEPGDALYVGDSMLVYEEDLALQSEPAEPCASPAAAAGRELPGRLRRIWARAAVGMAALGLIAAAVLLALAAG